MTNEERLRLSVIRVNSPLYKLKERTRNLIYQSFKRACNGGYRKSKTTEEYLGCEMSVFVMHIESQFKDGMSLKNYGLWHIDHIKPLSLANTEEEVYKLSHYTNLQPLWARDNIKKSAKHE